MQQKNNKKYLRTLPNEKLLYNFGWVCSVHPFVCLVEFVKPFRFFDQNQLKLRSGG